MKTISASKYLQVTLTGAVLCSATALADSQKANENGPDMDFLEYLGMWDESDEDWQLLNTEDDAAEDRQGESVPKGNASRETDRETKRETGNER